MDPKELTAETLAGMIDHAVLAPNATADDLRAGCDLVDRLAVLSICVRPCDVAEAARRLDASDAMVGTVIGFPHGAVVTDVKAAEARRAVDDGAEELDMVVNIGWLRDGQPGRVRDDISAVVSAAGGVPVKVILECCYLGDEQIIAGCELSVQAGAAFVKTSTGFGTHGARPEHVHLMRQTVGADVGVKAAGGIRTLDDVNAMVSAGANRIGTSRTDELIQALTRQQ